MNDRIYARAWGILLASACAMLSSCAFQAETADLIVHNARIYTLDEEGTVAGAMAIRGGLIVETGPERHILNKYSSPDYLDCGSRTVVPGFVDVTGGRLPLSGRSHGGPEARQQDNAQAVGDSTASWQEELLRAAQQCLSEGVTLTSGVAPAADWKRVDSLHRSGELKLCIFGMLPLDSSGIAYCLGHAPDTLSGRLSLRSVAACASAAAGYGGSCGDVPCHLARAPGHARVGEWSQVSGAEFEWVLEGLLDRGYQVCVEACPDGAAAEVVRQYCEVLEGSNDRRWRLHGVRLGDAALADRIRECTVVPVLMPLAGGEGEMGETTVAGGESAAEEWSRLKEALGWLPLGMVTRERAFSPLAYYAALGIRMGRQEGTDGGGEGVFSREEILRGMTIWAALALGEEQSRGSLEPGKRADLVVVDVDILQAPPEALGKAGVSWTVLGGEVVHAGGR